MKKIVVSKEELKEEKMKVNKQTSHVSNQKETSNNSKEIKKPNSTLKGKVKTITFGIDNGDGNFELQEDENGFKTTKGKFTSYFAKSLDEKELVKLSKDNHEVSLNFLGKKSKIGKISKVRGKVISSKKEKSSISFENFEKGLDLNYEVHSHGIKENIIVREKQDEYSFDFSLNIGSLTPRYNEETKCIELCDNDKIIYRILSPYMKDSSEKTSFDCFYDIEQDGEVLNLTLIADASWINDDKRVLPVIIDPTIEVVSDIFEMTGTAYSDNGKLNLIGYQKVGGSSWLNTINFRINRSTIIKTLSNLSKIFLKFYVKKVDDNISDNSKIIAICDGKTLLTIEKEDYLGEHFIDITDAFNSVTEDVMNIELKYDGSTNYSSFNVRVCSLLAEEKYRPKLNIEYLDEEDIQKIPENYYSLGRAGTTFINLKNGNFRHVHRDAKIDLKTLSYTINHVFDSSVYADKKLEITPAYMGKGWKTNLHQYLIKSDTFNQVLGSKDVTYIDGDGFAHKLHERWYYLVNGEKIFVNREDIFLDSDQKLKIMDYDGDIQEVNVEIKNDEGLSYISGMNLTSFKSNKKRKRYYLKYENFGSLEVDVDSNQNHLSFFYYNPNTGAKVWVEPKSVKRNSFGDLVGPTNQPVSIDIEFVNDVILNINGTYSVKYKYSSFTGEPDKATQYELIDTFPLEESSEEEEIVDLYVNEDITNLNLQIKQVESYIKNLEFSKTVSFYANLATLKNIENALNSYAKQKQYIQYNKVFDTLSEDIQNAKKIFFDRCGDRYLEYMAKADGTTDFSTLKAYAESFGIVNSEYNPGNNENAQKLPATMVSAFNSGLQRFTDKTYYINSFSLAKTRELAKEIQDLSLEGSITTLSTRIESQSADYFNILNTLANYNQQLKDLQNKKDSLIEEQMRKANDFIVDKDGNALGFDGYGRLISILGSFENEINIDYGFDDENEGKLLYVTSGVETVKFNYDKESGLLKSLIDCSGRKTKFEYDDNNCLVSVKYNDSKTSSFIYENNIISFTSPLLETIELDLNTDNQLFVCQKCLEGKIDSNSKISALDSQKTISEEQYTFGINNITTIYDSFYKKTITYQFDNLGRLLHIKDNEYEEIVHYEKGLVKHTAKFKTDNSISTLEQFGLSGVTATKEFDLSKYRTTFKNDLPISNLLAIKLVLGSIMNEADISLSKFDIKVNVISSNENDTKIEEFKLVYQEVYNQTVILPIVIDRELSTTIQFSLSNTYDESEGSFFKSAELIKLESGTIYTYDEENHLIKKQDGTNTTVYEDYNENDIPLKVTNTNIYGDEVVTIYSYNSDRQLTNVEDSKGNVEEYYYNDKGRCIEKRIYNKKDASLMKVEKIEYDENGRLLSSKGSIKDQKGNYPTEEVTYLPNTNIKIKYPL